MRRQVSDGGRVGFFPRPNREHHLMLLRLQVFGAGGHLAKMLKTADLVPKFAQSPIVGSGQRLRVAMTDHVTPTPVYRNTMLWEGVAVLWVILRGSRSAL